MTYVIPEVTYNTLLINPDYAIILYEVKVMTRCEYCGASVAGDICEYCDMPLKNKKPAPVKVIYKSDKSKSTVSLPVIKHKKKFFRKILAGVFAVCAVNFIVMAVLANYNISRTYIESPYEYDVEYGDDEIYYDSKIYYNDDSYNIEEVAGELQEYPANEAFIENGAFPSGTYQIGVDMPEGLYIFIPDMADGHGVEGVYSDPECENQISSAYVHFDGSRIAEISGNGYVDFSWATAYNLDMHPEIMNDPYESDGMFIVGRDIEAGTYTLEETGNMSEYAEWYIYSSINAVGAVLKESGMLYSEDGYEENITNEITINDGEYLELRNCIITD